MHKDDIEKYIDNQKDFLNDYEKESARKIYIKKHSTMETPDIISFLKKKGFKEESIKYVVEEEE